MAKGTCYVCGRWDGTHSGGCPRAAVDYIGAPRYSCPTCKRADAISAAEYRRGYQCAVCTKRTAAAYGDGLTDTGW